ncbi:MAG: hypothetical protein ACRD41_16150 [Candidatus Acidiferrales bacterium]
MGDDEKEKQDFELDDDHFKRGAPIGDLQKTDNKKVRETTEKKETDKQ